MRVNDLPELICGSVNDRPFGVGVMATTRAQRPRDFGITEGIKTVAPVLFPSAYFSGLTRETEPSHFDHADGQDAEFFCGGDAGAGGEDIVAGGFDALEQAVIDADENLEGGAAFLVDEGQEKLGGFVIFVGAGGDVFKHGALIGCGRG